LRSSCLLHAPMLVHLLLEVWYQTTEYHGYERGVMIFSNNSTVDIHYAQEIDMKAESCIQLYPSVRACLNPMISSFRSQSMLEPVASTLDHLPSSVWFLFPLPVLFFPAMKSSIGHVLMGRRYSS
jgi:hypothetical protein